MFFISQSGKFIIKSLGENRWPAVFMSPLSQDTVTHQNLDFCRVPIKALVRVYNKSLQKSGFR